MAPRAVALQQLHPPIAEHDVGGEVAPPLAALDVDALGAQIEALLRQAAQRLRQQADARRARESGHDREHTAARPASKCRVGKGAKRRAHRKRTSCRSVAWARFA